MATKRFSARKNFTKKSLQNAPGDKPIVYKILNKNGENIYTGSAKRGRVSERLAEHLAGAKDKIPGATYFQIKQMSKINEAMQEEDRIINKEDPKYNRT